MSKSDQNARVSNRTNETNNQSVISLTRSPEQKENDDKAKMDVSTKQKNKNKNGLNWEESKKDQSSPKEPIQRENIRYY